MNYLDALRLTHSILAPRNYLEIGCRHGASLFLADCPAIGVDPAFELRRQPRPGVRLFEMTSDAFFEGNDPRLVFGAPVDLAFIDGMHLAEYALRDFVNTERVSHRGGVVVIDDVLPDRMEYASRERNTRIWTGDVYRVVLALRELRPGLDIRVYAVEMKGFCLVHGLEPGDRTLAGALDDVHARLADGAWEVPSREALVEALRPLPPAQLEVDLRALSQWRGQLAG